MVGIPKSNRCSFCKARKTKCDETWPTCGTCQRAKRPCSGPPKMKFIVNGCHSAAGGYDSASSTSSGRSDISIPKHEKSDKQAKPAPLRSQKRQPKPIWDRVIHEDGGSFHRMRFPRHPAPRVVTPAPSERLAAELIWCLDAAPGTGLDLRLWGASLELLPPLLVQSTALQHATKLLVTSWSNMQRGWTRCKWLDAQLYDAALRSLQQALEQAFEETSSASCLTTTTLAAQTILHKLEIVCNDVSMSYQSSHAAGLSAVISTGGYSRGFSELDLHLIFESFFTLLMNDVRCGKESVLAEPCWSAALHKALDTTPLKPTLLSRFYRFWTEVAIWPTLVRRLRHLHANPTDVMLAAEVALQAGGLLEYLDGLDQSVFAKAVELGSIVEVESKSRNSHHAVQKEEEEEEFMPKSYEFANYNLANFFSAHAFFTLVTLRILHCAQSVLAGGYCHTGEDQTCQRQGQAAEPCHRVLDFSRRLWQAHPYMRRRRPLELGRGWQLVVAYETGDARQKALTCAALRGADEVIGGDMSEESSPPLSSSPSSSPAIAVPLRDDEDAIIMAEVMTLTGRSYDLHQNNDELFDWEAELQSMDSVDLSSDLMSYDFFSWDYLQGSVLG